MTKYEIRTGGAKGSLWGWSKTLEAARKKAAKLSKDIRSDVAVCIVVDGAVVERSGVSGIFTGQPRPTEPVSE